MKISPLAIVGIVTCGFTERGKAMRLYKSKNEYYYAVSDGSRVDVGNILTGSDGRPIDKKVRAFYSVNALREMAELLARVADEEENRL
jgi:hypothetical protein